MANSIVPSEGVLLGRARVPGHEHPRVITVRGEDIVDITAKTAPTSRDIAEQADPAAYVASAKGPVIGNLHQILANSWSGKTDLKAPSLLSPPACWRCSVSARRPVDYGRATRWRC